MLASCRLSSDGDWDRDKGGEEQEELSHAPHLPRWGRGRQQQGRDVLCDTHGPTPSWGVLVLLTGSPCGGLPSPSPFHPVLHWFLAGCVHGFGGRTTPPIRPYSCLSLQNWGHAELPSPGVSCHHVRTGHGGRRHKALGAGRGDLFACTQRAGRRTALPWHDPRMHASHSEGDSGLLHVSQPKVQCCISGQLGV